MPDEAELTFEEYARAGRCDNDGVWGIEPCTSGHPRAVTMFRATAPDDMDAQSFLACDDCTARVREMLLTGKFDVEEYSV